MPEDDSLLGPTLRAIIDGANQVRQFFSPDRAPADLEQRIAAATPPPTAYEKWWQEPAALKVVRLFDPSAQPAQQEPFDSRIIPGIEKVGIVNWLKQYAQSVPESATTPETLSMALPVHKLMPGQKALDIQKPPSVRRILGELHEEPVNRGLDPAGSGRGGPEVAAEELQQTTQLRANQHPDQSIVTISDANDWLQSRGLQPAEHAAPAQAIRDFIESPDYSSLNIFDRTRIAAQLQRRSEENVYAPEMGVQTANKKQGESGVLGVDTIRGCDQNCFGCYAAKLAMKGGIEHEVPVRTELKGTLHEDQLMRVGTAGEPAKDWNWTNEQVDGVIERSQARGRNVTPEENVHAITKLLNIDGYDSKSVPNLEVSIDPLYPQHMRQSMANALRLKHEFPDANVVLRIRSVETLNPDLNESQNAAIKFANRFQFPVLETRMRFNQNDAFAVLELDPSKYEKVGNQWKAKAILKDKVNDWHLCDRVGGGCATCGTCRKLMIDRRQQNIDQVNSAMETEGIAGSSFRGFPRSIDVRGSTPVDPRLVQMK